MQLFNITCHTLNIDTRTAAWQTIQAQLESQWVHEKMTTLCLNRTVVVFYHMLLRENIACNHLLSLCDELFPPWSALGGTLSAFSDTRGRRRALKCDPVQSEREDCDNLTLAGNMHNLHVFLSRPAAAVTVLQLHEEPPRGNNRKWFRTFNMYLISLLYGNILVISV